MGASLANHRKHVLSLGKGDPAADQGSGAVRDRVHGGASHRFSVHKDLHAHSRPAQTVAENRQVIGAVGGGQDLIGEGIPILDRNRPPSPGRRDGFMILQSVGRGDQARLLGYGLVLIRAAVSAYRRRTADEAKGGLGARGDIADGTARKGAVLQGTEEAVVHVEGVIPAAPLDLEGLETIKAGVLPEGTDTSHLGTGSLPLDRDLDDNLLPHGIKEAGAEVLPVGVGEDRSRLSPLGDRGHVVFGGEIPVKWSLGQKHTAGTEGKPASSRAEGALQGPALERGAGGEVMVHVGKLGYGLGIGGGTQNLHALAVEPNAVDVHVAIGHHIHQRMVDNIVAVQVRPLDRGAVTDAEDRVGGADEQRILRLRFGKVQGRAIRNAVENTVGGAEDVVTRIGDIVVTVMVYRHGALCPSAVDGDRAKSAAASHGGGGFHVVHLNIPAACRVEIPFPVVVHEYRSVNGHSHIIRNGCEALGGGAAAQNVVTVARGGGVHIEIAVVVVYLRSIGAAGHGMIGAKALERPVDQIGRGPALDAHASVLGAAIQVVDTVMPHDEGIAKAVAGPRVFGLSRENGILEAGNTLHGFASLGLIIRRGLCRVIPASLGIRRGTANGSSFGNRLGCCGFARGAAGAQGTHRESDDEKKQPKTFHADFQPFGFGFFSHIVSHNFEKINDFCTIRLT